MRKNSLKFYKKVNFTDFILKTGECCTYNVRNQKLMGSRDAFTFTFPEDEYCLASSFI